MLAIASRDAVDVVHPIVALDPSRRRYPSHGDGPRDRRFHEHPARLIAQLVKMERPDDFRHSNHPP